jgi:hypothetical protein
VAKKKKIAVKPGYRLPRTAREQAFWDRYQPDYRAWAVKHDLTLDEASALAMGLDPKCVEHIPDESGQTPARFEATKAWFKNVEREFKQTPGSVLGIQVFAWDFGLRVENELGTFAEYSSEGFLEQDKLISRLNRKISSQEKTIERLQRHIARKRSDSPKAKRVSDQTRSENTTSKLIIALLAEVMRRNGLKEDLQLLRLKNDGNNNCVSQAMGTLIQMNWKMDESTLNRRLEEAIKVWNPESE